MKFYLGGLMEGDKKLIIIIIIVFLLVLTFWFIEKKD
jgi:hypothetical protein